MPKNGLSSTSSRWRRNLYESTGLPDNDTPNDCFLAAIERNKNVNRFTFADCLPNACQVALQLSAIVLFYDSYVALKENLLESIHLVTYIGILSLAVYLHVFKVLGLSRRSHLDDFRHAVIFVSFGFGLSPVLYKLTDTISTDTIHSMGFCALFLHLLSHNYHRSLGDSTYRTSALSLNASLFASVCLASRLQSSFDAFVLLFVAVNAFVMWPLVRSKVVPSFVFMLTVIVGGTAVMLSSIVSMGFAMAVAMMLLLVTILAPTLFVKWQDHKDTIHGPWDEAVPVM